MLERVDGRRGDGGLVEHAQVPDVEVHRPQRQRHDGMGEVAQRAQAGVAQDRREQRPGEAEHEQQRAEVGDQQVLDHVRPEELLGQRASGETSDAR